MIAMKTKKTRIILPNGIGMAELGPSKHTKPERMVRMWLVRNKVKFELHWPIPDSRRSVDILVRDICVFVHGRFWHDPSWRADRMSDYWKNKVTANRKRDRDTIRICKALGLRTLVIWDDRLARGLARLARLLELPSASSTAERSSRRRT